MPVKTNPLTEQQRHRDKAKDAFVRAASALTVTVFDDGVDNLYESRAFAMLEALTGVMYLAKSDPDEKVLERIVAVLEAAQKRAES